MDRSTLFLRLTRKQTASYSMISKEIKQEDIYGERENLSYFGRIEKG